MRFSLGNKARKPIHKKGKCPKIVIVGGGSYFWTSTLMTDIALTASLDGSHIVLQDINPDALEITVPLSQKIARQADTRLKIEGTTDLDSSLNGADFVLVTISTGGSDADELDHTIPARHGVLQTVGDSVGPGGWSRALRNIPVLVDIVRRVQALAPRAYLLNYTNPMTTLTRALRIASPVRSMGLCHELQGTLLHLAYFLGVDWRKDFAVKLAGINHLIWILELNAQGHDGLALLRQYIDDPDRFVPLSPRQIPIELQRGGGLAPSHKVQFDLLRSCGALPAAGDVHLAEFFSHYLSPEAHHGADWDLRPGGIQKTFAHAKRDKSRRKALDQLESPEPLELYRSHEHSAEIMAALTGDGSHIVTPLNLPNVGQINNLPRQALVETMALVDGAGVQPVAVGDLPELIVHHLMRHITTQEMIVEAALAGDRELAVHALSCDPLIPNPQTAARIAEDFFQAFSDRGLLPQFNGQWSLA